MSPLLVLSFLTVLGVQVGGDDACADVFDRTEDCPQVDDTPVEGMAEAIGFDEVDFTPEEVDASTVGLQLLFIAASIATLAVGFHAAQVFYGLHYLNTRDAGRLTATEAQRLTMTNGVIGMLALVSWVGSILIAGTGVAFFIFDPKDGSVIPLFQGGE